MKKTTLFFKVGIALMCLLSANKNALAIYTPVAVTGYNADVVADVAGNATGSTTNDFDGVNFVFMSQSYNSTGTSFLPASGVISSAVATTVGLTYQLASYTANNSLRLSGTSSGTLTVTTPISAQTIYILGSSGSGASTASITVTFTDGTTQVFTGQAFGDWYNGANYAVLGLGRANRVTNVITNDASNPRLYQVPLALLASNYSKLVASITVANTGAVLNVMGVSFDVPPVPCTGKPTAGNAVASILNPCPGIAVNFSLVGTSPVSNLGYQWYRSVNNWVTWNAIAGGINSTLTATPPATGLTYCYRCIVTCLSSGLKDTSGFVCETVQVWSPTSSCWCVPTYVNGGTADFITNVSIGTLTNNTAAAGNPSPYYVNYTGAQSGGGATLPIPSLFAGLATNLSVSYSTDPNQYIGVWIDYDHNGLFDATEFTSPGTNAGGSGTHIVSITPPGTSQCGNTRMRIRGGDDVQCSSTQACGATNSTWGETEDYIVNIICAPPYDPTVTSISGPSGNCYSTSETVTAQICNNGQNAINLALNPVTVTLHLNGAGGGTTYTTVLNSGTMNPYGASCYTATFNNVNLYAGGTYSLNTTLSLSGLTNGNLADDSLANGVLFQNYRPTPGPDYHLCQGSQIPFGQGLTVSGCATPITVTDTINFTITGPCTDNTGATSSGSSIGPNNANCNDIYACNFANGIAPTLPAGASFVSAGTLQVNNIGTVASSASYAQEVRMSLYVSSLNPTSNIVSPGLQGATGFGNPNFNYQRTIPSSQLSAMYSALLSNSTNTVNIGYWESYNDVVSGSDIFTNAGGTTTVARLIFTYQYVPASFEWYNVPTGGSSLYSYSPYAPVGFNSNIVGPTTYYAACVGSSTCRVPVNIVVDPTPLSFQDTLTLCEYSTGANVAIFDLTQANGGVSGNVLGTSVNYFGDQALFSPIATPLTDTSSSSVVYAKVYYTATGCFSSDSLVLHVNPIPEFTAPSYAGFACSPSILDVASLLTGNSLAGLDTFYYSDPACTILHPNPHSVSIADTVYIVVKTQGVAVCSDTAIAYIDITPASNLIVNQSSFNTSISGSIGCNNITLLDGAATDTLHNAADCRKVVAIRDEPDGVSLGSTSVCEDIDASVQYHNGQPYVIRHYQITPTNNDSAMVCLYFLDDDLDNYNNATFGSGWPQMPTSSNMSLTGNFCIAKVDNGDLNLAGHTVTSIPNTSITSSYDPTSYVWTLCFPVSSFSYFYLHTQNPGNIPLPVTATFTGKKVDQTSELTWITSMEYNNSHFIIERSKDGRTFTALSNEIASKAVNGNSSEKLTYTFTDKAPMSGHNYYRLQQNDIDKHQSYHPTIVDIYYGSEEMVSVYPNPMSSTLTVEINVPKATNAIAKIIDATGRVVRTTEMQLQTGFNKNVIDVQDLADGVYMFQISNNKGLNYSQSIRKK